MVCLQLLYLKPWSGRIYDDRTQCRDFGEEYLKLPCSSGSPLRQARALFFFRYRVVKIPSSADPKRGVTVWDSALEGFSAIQDV